MQMNGLINSADDLIGLHELGSADFQKNGKD